MSKRFDVWALLGEGKQAGWSRVGWDLPSEVVEELTRKPGQYHIEESRPKKEQQGMAKATIVPEHEVVVPEQVNLTMSIAEAQTLWCVLRRVAGSTDKSNRKHTDAVLKALDDAGVYVSYADRTRAVHGVVRFEDTEDGDS